MAFRHSLAFLANREEDFTRILSTGPAGDPPGAVGSRHASPAEVPVMPLSAYVHELPHSGLAVMRLCIVGVLSSKGLKLILRAGAHPGEAATRFSILTGVLGAMVITQGVLFNARNH